VTCDKYTRFVLMYPTFGIRVVFTACPHVRNARFSSAQKHGNVYSWGIYRNSCWRFSCMKMTVIWDVASCSLGDIGRRFIGVDCLHHQDPLITEVISASETSANFYRTMLCKFQKTVIMLAAVRM
jgi:hypothetical protein